MKHGNPALTMKDLVDHIIGLRDQRLPAPAIVTFCFSDMLALKACLTGCLMERTIPVIMTTFNQVNADGGYADLTASGFTSRVHGLAHELGYHGPIIFGRDHGGPYTLAGHHHLSRRQAMAWVKQNITEDLNAGFSCWHADGTSGRDDEKDNGSLPIDLVVDATVEMLVFCEQERQRLRTAPLSYEVGSEEQKGGLTSPNQFDAFLDRLSRRIADRDLTEARMDFVVAQTGTRMKLKRRKGGRHFYLYQDGFKPDWVRSLNQIAEKYRHPFARLLFTQHYSDYIRAEDAAALLRFGAGKINFGPEMTMPELIRLLSWETAERRLLAESGRTAEASGFREAMIREMDNDPAIWHHHLPETTIRGPVQFTSLAGQHPNVQDALIVFRGRYVKNRPACADALQRLLRNTRNLDIDRNPEKTIIEDILNTAVLPRLKQFRMSGLLDAVAASHK
jgi:tagatose-1,6-bisphosphate aldolase non-catalytic subunit AgaZ/GatZ